MKNNGIGWSFRWGILLSFLFPAFSDTWAQDRYQAVLQQIEQNSTGLKLAKEQQKAKELDGALELFPENPEVGYSHTWGNEQTGGNTQGVTVTQTIDFPTVYVNKSKLADFKASSAAQRYLVDRMDLLLSAKELCIEMTYYNALVQMYRRQVEHARQIADAQQQRKDSGEGNAIEYNKSKLNLLYSENNLKLNIIELDRLHTELVRLNGGMEINFEDTAFPMVSLPEDFETFYQNAVEIHPFLNYLKQELAVSQEEVRLNQSVSLPKISLGYNGQFAGQQNFHGVSVGLSIPLWENHNQVKKAKAESVAVEYQINDRKVMYYNQLKSSYNQVVTLQESILAYHEFLNEYSNSELLYESFQSGELSLLDYLLQIEYYFDIYEKYLMMQKDLALAHARLTAFEL